MKNKFVSLPVKIYNDDDCCKMLLKVNIGRNAMFFAQTINHDKEIFVARKENNIYIRVSTAFDISIMRVNRNQLKGSCTGQCIAQY